jgi:superfamily II DNA/RNA helicase
MLDYIYPTPIQELCIPAVLSGKDVLGSSVTGTGKTAAFLLPMLHKYTFSQYANYTKVLIITPTRELAL